MGEHGLESTALGESAAAGTWWQSRTQQSDTGEKPRSPNALVLLFEMKRKQSLSDRQRELILVLLLCTAAGGIAAALLLPPSQVADCPNPASHLPCQYHTDRHMPIRVLLAAAGCLPALIVLGSRRRFPRWFPWAAWLAGTAGAVLLALQTGLVTPYGVDCPPYPQCFGPGHPYIWSPLLLFLAVSAGAYALSGPTRRGRVLPVENVAS